MKQAFAIALLLISLVAFAQAPAVDCPLHHQPALFTGNSKTVSGTIVYEYCHYIQNQGNHCFWVHT